MSKRNEIAKIVAAAKSGTVSLESAVDQIMAMDIVYPSKEAISEMINDIEGGHLLPEERGLARMAATMVLDAVRGLNA